MGPDCRVKRASSGSRRDTENTENQTLQQVAMQLLLCGRSPHDGHRESLVANPNSSESTMMRTVQLSIADTGYAEHLKNALQRSGPWRVERVDYPHVVEGSVMVLDELAFARLPHLLENPERVVLITHQDPELLAQAWEAGIVSVVSNDDSVATVLLAIMAASLRVAKPHSLAEPSVISPSAAVSPAQLSPDNQISRSKRCKIR